MTVARVPSSAALPPLSHDDPKGARKAVRNDKRCLVRRSDQRPCRVVHSKSFHFDPKGTRFARAREPFRIGGEVYCE